MAEFIYATWSENGDYLTEESSSEAQLRISTVLWKRYLDARAKLSATEAEINVRAEQPLVVTPDQEAAMRAAARPGTWIVVRSVVQVQEPSAERMPGLPGASADENGQPEAVLSLSPPAPEEPSGPPKRPPLGRCPSRGNMPHTVMRYVQTDAMSVYFPGRKRIDGLCQCGLRIADVKCPHQKQQLVGQVPTCAWCGHKIIAQAGNIDNRDANGAPDPRIPTLIPIGAAGDDPAVRTAFRVESE